MRSSVLVTVVVVGFGGHLVKANTLWNDLVQARRASIADSIATNCHGDVSWMVVQSRADDWFRWRDLDVMGLSNLQTVIGRCGLRRLWRIHSFGRCDGKDNTVDWCFSYASAYVRRNGRRHTVSTKDCQITLGSYICNDDYILLALLRRQPEIPDDVSAPDCAGEFFSRHVYRPVPGGVFRLSCTNQPHVAELELDDHLRRTVSVSLAKARQFDAYVTISLREMSEVVYLCQKGDAAERLKIYNGFRKDCPLLEDMSDGVLRTDLGKDLEKAFERWRGKSQNGTITGQEKSR